MILRKLELKDATLMLEWMHDKTVVNNLKVNFMSKTIEDCESFIINSWNDKENLHLAIDVNGEYMGTVSLKNIEKNEAEFAITIRKVAMGRGISKKAMAEIIRIGFEEKGLKKIYWYVDSANQRAIKFYDKNGYQRIDNPEFIKIEDNARYIWYQVER